MMTFNRTRVFNRNAFTNNVLAISTAICILLGVTPALAEGEILTLDQAIEMAQENNPDYLAAKANLDIARGRLVRARYVNQFNPSIRGRGMTRQFDITGGGSATQSNVFLFQRWEVAGQPSLRLEEAQRNLSTIEAQIGDQERLLNGLVRRAFYASLVAKERLLLLRTIEDLNRRVRNAVVERFRAGATAIIQANIAKIRLGQSRKETLAEEAALETALAQLRRIMGVSPDRTFEPRGDLRGISQQVSLPALLSKALEERSDLEAVRREIQRVKAETSLTKRLIVPNPEFQAFYQTMTDTPGRLDNIYGAGIRLPLPLFDRKQAELVTLAGQAQQRRHQANATLRTIEREVTQAFQEYEAARQGLDVFETDVLGAVKENFEFIEIAYREGKISLLQFIVVQNDLVKAQLSYIDTLSQFRTAETNLQQAVGGSF